MPSKETGGPALPASVGRYRPKAVLGAGAMGIIYLAYDPAVDRQVAIKVMRTEGLDVAARAEYLQRFRSEIRAASRCFHPAIVTIYDASDDAARPYIVMEFIEGRTLAALLRDGTARDVPVLTGAMLQVLDGLTAAHGLGVVHRDIKPANIILTSFGQAKITDFGIARLDAGQLTEIGTVLGTPGYMAPEQALGQAADQRADLFSVATILYEIAAGKPPFAGATLPETIHRLTGPEPASLEPVIAAGGASIAPVLQRGLAKIPAQRFQSAEDFAASLRAAMGAGAPVGHTAPDAATLVAARPPAVAFDPQLLDEVEARLARYIGPVAQTVVRRSAAQAASLDQFHHMVEATLERPGDRAAFASERLAAAGSTSLGRSGSGTSTGGLLSAVPAGLLPNAMIAVAEEALAFYLGPIAKVLVRKAAIEARSPAEFQKRLADHLIHPEEAEAFRRRLRARLRA